MRPTAAPLRSAAARARRPVAGRGGHADQLLRLAGCQAAPGRRRRRAVSCMCTRPRSWRRSIGRSRSHARFAATGLQTTSGGVRAAAGSCIRRERRSCGRRWCDAVRPSWASSFRSVIHSALDAYCDLYGSEAKLLQGVLTCTAEPWWWDASKCTHPAAARVLGAARMPRARLSRGGSAAALVGTSSRDAECGSDGCDPSVAARGLDGGAVADACCCGCWRISHEASRISISSSGTRRLSRRRLLGRSSGS